MEDQPIHVEVLSPPSLDVVNYGNNFLNFLMNLWPHLIEGTRTFIAILIGISIPISILLFIGIIVAVERLKVIRKAEEEYYNPPVEVAYDAEGKPDKETINKWKQVLEHVESHNPNDWRQSIIEADIMLEDLLTRLGYKGEGIGEKLKRVEKGDFMSIDDAWEAHKVRNRIAHDGSDYPLTQSDARKVINMYKRVFEEFYYI